MEWISVKDRMPKQLCIKQIGVTLSIKKVLVCHKSENGFNIDVGFTKNGKWHYSFDDEFEETVTHWMPLPEPPKEEN